MIAAVKKVAKKCSGSCQSLSCQKMSTLLSKVWGFFSRVGAAFLGLCLSGEDSKVARVCFPLVPEMLKDS